MRSENRIVLIVICAVILAVVAAAIIGFSESQVRESPGTPALETTPSEVSFSNNEMNLRFVYEKNDCSFDGEVYLNREDVGKTKGGQIAIPLESFGPATVKIIGETDDCFGEDAWLPISGTWEIENTEDYVNFGEAALVYDTDVRVPQSFEEYMGYVRPYETKNYLDGLKLTGTTEENIDKIVSFRFSYNNFDHDIRTPAETLKTDRGDCKAWAATSLSAIKQYDPSLECYEIIWPTHVSVFCSFDGKYYIYDQENVKSEVSIDPNARKQDNEIKFRKFLNSYFDSYGLAPNERKVVGIFDEDSYKEFGDTELFVDWALSK